MINKYFNLFSSLLVLSALAYNDSILLTIWGLFVSMIQLMIYVDKSEHPDRWY